MDIDRRLFSEELDRAVSFIETAPMSEEDREKICHLNAEKLFSLC